MALFDYENINNTTFDSSITPDGSSTYVDPLTGQTYTSQKEANLNANFEKKKARLLENQGASFEEGSYSIVNGQKVLNRNKFFNTDTAEQRQQKLSDVADQQVFRDESTGEMYQFDRDIFGNEVRKPFSGSTRRLYAYGTQADDNFIKLGVSRGDVDTSDVRYDPDLAKRLGVSGGWKPGPEGVDIRKNYMDLLLPSNVATEAEAYFHGNVDSIGNRVSRFEDIDGKTRFGSGRTEIYSSPEGLFGDTSESKSAQEPTSGIDLLTESGKPKSKALLDVERSIQERKASDIGFRASNALKSFAATASKEIGVDLIDMVGEGLSKVTGYGWDLGDERAKTEMVNNFFGYDDSIVNKELSRAKDLGKKVYDDAIDDNKDVEYSDVAEMIKIGVVNPELLGQSLGYVLGLTLGFGKFTKAGKMAKTIAAEQKAGKITKAEAANKLSDISVLDNTKKLLAENAGLLNVAAGNVNDQIDEFKQNNNGQDPGIADVSRMMGIEVVMNGLDRFVDVGILTNTGLSKGIKEVSKGMSASQLNTVAKAVGKTATGLLLNSGKEAAQEYVQEMGQMFNTQFGTAEYGTDIGKIFTDAENVIDAGTAAALGAGGAIQFEAVGLAGKVANLQVAADVANKASDLAKQGVDIASNIGKGSVSEDAKESVKKAEEEEFSLAEEQSKRINDTLDFLSSADLTNKDSLVKSIELLRGIDDSVIEDEEQKKILGAMRSTVAYGLRELKKQTLEDGNEQTMKDLGSDEGSVENIKRFREILSMLDSAEEADKESISKNINKFGEILGLSDEQVKKIIDERKKILSIRKTIDDVEAEVTIDPERGYETYYNNIQEAITDGDRKKAELYSSKLVDFALKQDDKAKLLKEGIIEAEADIRRRAEEYIDAGEATSIEQAYSLVAQDDGQKIYYSEYSPDAKPFEINTSNVVQNKLDPSSRPGAYSVLDRAEESVREMKRLASEIDIDIEKVDRIPLTDDEVDTDKVNRRKQLRNTLNKLNTVYNKYKGQDFSKIENESDKKDVYSYLAAQKELQRLFSDDRKKSKSTISEPKPEKKVNKKKIDYASLTIDDINALLDKNEDKYNKAVSNLSRGKATDSDSKVARNFEALLRRREQLENEINKEVKTSSPGSKEKQVSSEPVSVKPSVDIPSIAEFEEASYSKPEDINVEPISESIPEPVSEIDNVKVSDVQDSYPMPDEYPIYDIDNVALPSYNEQDFNNAFIDYDNIVSEVSYESDAVKKKVAPKVSDKIENLKSNLEAFTSSVDSLMSYIETLRKERRGLIKKDMELRTAIKASNSRIKSLTKKIGRAYDIKENKGLFSNISKMAKRLISLLESYISRLQKSVDIKKTERDSIKKRILEINKNIDKLYRTSTPLREDIEDIKSQLVGVNHISSIIGKKNFDSNGRALPVTEGSSIYSGSKGTPFSGIKGQQVNPINIVEASKSKRTRLSSVSLNEDSISSDIESFANEAVDIIENVLLSPSMKNGRVTRDEVLAGKSSLSRGLLFNVDKDGNIYTDKNVSVAIASAAEEYISYLSSNLSYNDYSDVARMIGVTDEEVEPHQQFFWSNKGKFKKVVADNLGGSIINNLALKARTDIDNETFLKLKADLGQVALLYMESKGYIEQLSNTQVSVSSAKSEGGLGRQSDFGNEFDNFKSGNEKFIPMVKLSKDLDIGNIVKNFKTVENDLILESNVKSYLFKKPKANRDFSIRRNDVTDIPEESVKVLNKISQEKFELNIDAVDNLIELGRDKVLELLGYKTISDDSNISFDSRESIRGRNMEIENSYDRLVELRDTIASGSEENAIYFDWFFTRNGRFMMDSVTVNPQSDKLHRFLVTPVSGNVEIDINNEKNVRIFKFAVAQAFGYDIDKKSTVDIISAADSLIDTDIDVLKSIYNDGSLEINGIEFEAEHVGHVVQAIQAIEKYKNVGKSGKFTTNLSVEFDAVTSGFILKLLQVPVLPSSETKRWLSKGGVFIDGENGYSRFNEVESMNDEIAIGSVIDGYRTLAGNMEEPVDVAEDNLGVWNELKEILPTIFDKIELDEKDEKGNNKVDKVVTSSGRSIFKAPFMTFGYGAALKSIRRHLGYKMTEDIPDMLLSDSSLREKILRSIMKDSYSELKDRAFVKSLKEEPFSEITIKNSEGKSFSFGDEIRGLIDQAYGEQVERVLTEQFKPIIDSNNVINNSFKMIFRAWKSEYDKRIKEFDGNPTIEQERQIIKDLRKLFPAIKAPLSDSFEDGVAIVDNGISSIPDYKHGAAQTMLSNGRSLKVNSMIRRFEEAISAGAVVPIHYIDGSLMTKILGKGGVLGIHDAFIDNLLRANSTAKDYNEQVYKISKEYSLVSELLDSYIRAYKTLGGNRISKLEPVKAGKEKLTFNDVGTMLRNLEETVSINRKELFSNNMKIMHMSALPGSAYDSSSDSSNIQPRNTVDDLGYGDGESVSQTVGFSENKPKDGIISDFDTDNEAELIRIQKELSEEFNKCGIK